MCQAYVCNVCVTLIRNALRKFTLVSFASICVHRISSYETYPAMTLQILFYCSLCFEHRGVFEHRDLPLSLDPGGSRNAVSQRPHASRGGEREAGPSKS